MDDVKVKEKISWEMLPKTPGGLPLSKDYEKDYIIDWSGYKSKKISRSYEDIKRRQAAYAKWKKEQEFKQSIYE